MSDPQTNDTLLKLSAFRRKCSNFNSMTLLSMTLVQISEFYLVCGIVLSRATPCEKFQDDVTINKGINCIFPVFCFVYFWTNERSPLFYANFLH